MKRSYHALISILIIAGFSTSHAQEYIYPVTAGIQPSVSFQVFVNNKAAFVYESPVPASYCSFDMSGPVDILIKANRDIKWVDIRPLSAQIKMNFKDSTIRFRLNKPQLLSIELNGSIKNPLFLFANLPEKNKPSRDDKNVIFFESGKIHYPGIIEIKSNQTVYIEGGAIVVGVITAKDARNIRITGRGIMDGSYNHKFSHASIKTGNIQKIKADTTGKYERFIELIRCEEVKIEGITLHNSTTWQVVPENCNRVHIDNIKIVSDQASDDGIDVVHCRNTLIENCFIRVKDDCVVLKAYLPVNEGQHMDSVRVQHCVFWNGIWGNAIEIGFELNGADVKNIVFRDIDIIHVQDGAAMSIHNAGTSTVSNILFDNIRVEDANQKLIDLAIFRSRYSEDGTEDESEWRKLYLNGAWDGVLMIPPGQSEFHAKFRGHIKNIVFRNIQVVDGPFPYSLFYGFDTNHLVENVRIENLTLRGKKISSLQKAKIYLENTKSVIVQ